MIAFFQWRLKFPESNQDDLKELLKQRIGIVKNSFKSLNVENASNCIYDDFFKKYQMHEEKSDSFLINNFHQIGLPDPFENDICNNFISHTSDYYKAHYNNISENITEPIYPKSRMTHLYSPS